MKKWFCILFALVLGSCEENDQNEQLDLNMIEKKDAIFYNVDTFRDSLQRVIVKTSYEAYVGNTVAKKWEVYDTLPDLGMEKVELTDDDDNTKQIDVKKPYQIFFREINHKNGR